MYIFAYGDWMHLATNACGAVLTDCRLICICQKKKEKKKKKKKDKKKKKVGNTR